MGGRRFALLVMGMSVGCSATLEDLPTDGPPDPSDSDSVDDSVPTDTTLGEFGAIAKHTAASDDAINEDDGTLTGDGLEMVFSIQDPDDGNNKHLWVTKRASLDAAWGTAIRLDEINQLGGSDETPRFANNGLTLYFASERNGNGTQLDIWMTTRPDLAGAWTTPTKVSGVDTMALEKTYTPCGDQYLVIVGGDIYQGEIGGSPSEATILNDSMTSETGPFWNGDCLDVYFTSPRGGGPAKIYHSTRATVDSPWSSPTVYTDYLATSMVGGAHEDPWFSDDGRIFSFASNADGTKDQYIVTR